MKQLFLLSLFAFSACNTTDKGKTSNSGADTLEKHQSPSLSNIDSTDKGTLNQSKTYANERFKDVTVEKIDSINYRVKGKGQIFEARFGWIIEDGHNELKQGFEDTDAGAPEWGNFNFLVTVRKARPNSTLHLILYETSAKDGSRVYELPVPLK